MFVAGLLTALSLEPSKEVFKLVDVIYDNASKVTSEPKEKVKAEAEKEIDKGTDKTGVDLLIEILKCIS